MVLFCNTPFKKSCASEGAIERKKEEKVSSIFSTGTNGIRFKTKIKKGKRDKKKLKAILLARVVRVPLTIPIP